MEPKEVFRLFVVRSPEPAPTVQPDRIGSSPNMDKLIMLLENAKTEELLRKLNELKDQLKLPEGESSILSKVTENEAGKILEQLKSRIHSDGKKRMTETLSPDKLKNQLIQIRDYLALDEIMSSRFVTTLVKDAGSTGKNDEEKKKREHLKNVLKAGVALFLHISKQPLSDKTIDGLLSNPLSKSTRLVRAIHQRQLMERQAKHALDRPDNLKSLATKRQTLQTLRTKAIDLLEELQNSEVAPPEKAPALSRMLPSWITYRMRRDGPNRPTRKAVQTEDFINELNKNLDDKEKIELNAIVALAKPKGMAGMFAVLEETICGVSTQTSLLGPEKTGYAFRALRSAYSRPNVPITPLGFMELMRVTEELVGYTAREVAHIENKSGGETRERLHVYTETNQNIISTEQFEETEETRDLQTTQRNELQTTSSQVAEEEFSINAGLNVTGSYGAGPVSVQVTASLAVGYRSSITTSQQIASNVSREIIAKTVSRMRQNQRKSQIATILRTTEERNRHEYKVTTNRADTYLWVEQINELKLRSYGKRLVLEFFIPEPGLPLALTYSQGGILEEPEEFKKLPSEITENNYGELKQLYGATGISPPPSEYLMVGTGNVRKFASDSNTRFYSYEEALKVPAGYIPYKVFVSAQAHGWCDVTVAFAGKEVYRESMDYWPASGYQTTQQSIDRTYVVTPMFDSSEVDQQSDGLSLTTIFTGNHHPNQYFWETAVNVSVLCRRSCRTYEQWQLETHDRIYAAYRARVAEHEERRASNPMAVIVAGPAAANRQAELDTIKRGAMYLLKGEPVFHDLFPVGDGGVPLTTFDIGGIEQLRSDLNFFEEAFEWKQSTFYLYPSFWGNEDRASERKRFKISDPKHSAFLAAGAARVVLPVQPGREREVLEYLADQYAAAYSDTTTDATPPTAETIFNDIWQELPPEPDPTLQDTWRKSLLESRQDLTLGQGTVSVAQDRRTAVFGSAAAAFDPLLDLGREIWIEGRQFFVTKITDSAGLNFELDNVYSGITNAGAQFLVGARTIGAPWRVTIPTSLVILKEFKDQILS